MGQCLCRETFAGYLKDVATRVVQFDRTGKQEEREVQLPGLGTAGGFSGEKTDSNVFYNFTSFTTRLISIPMT